MSMLDKVIISPNASIKDAIKQLNENTMQILFVADERLQLLGTITDGDIRRELVGDLDLSKNVTEVMSRTPQFLYEVEIEKAEGMMLEKSITQIPILDSSDRIVDIILWKNLTDKKHSVHFGQKNNPVFILAGGKGTRLKPFTNVLPKPLIPLGEVPIVEIIMKRFQHYGFSKFILSLNYKAEMIKSYFSENAEEYDIQFVQEKNFSGTAGSLSLIRDSVQDTILVSNCDIIMDLDFDELFWYHKKNINDATIVGVIQNLKIPYGVMDIQEGSLISMKEKPEFDFIINAGIYVLEPSVIQFVEDGKYIDMPTLLWNAKENGLKVGVFPSSNEMIDMGQWEEYHLAVEKATKLKFI